MGLVRRDEGRGVSVVAVVVVVVVVVRGVVLD